MKKFYIQAIALMMMSGSMVAQSLPEGMVSLLPAGVKSNIDDDHRIAQRKSIVVAGSKDGGYNAFFAATDEDHGEELWVTDGTPAGTRLVKDINPGTTGSDLNYLTRFNNKVVFAADDGTNGYQLWISDGTEAGTTQILINELGDASPVGFNQLNETQFIFAATTFDSENYSATGAQQWLWISDGTQDGTKLLKDCKMDYPGKENYNWTTPYKRVGRKVFFKADDKDDLYGTELWVTDGTEAGTHLVKDINIEKDSGDATKTRDSAIDNMFNFYNEKLFFKAWSIESGNEPWASDGTEDGTYEIYDTNPGADANGLPKGSGCGDEGFTPYNGYLYFRGWSEATGWELARTNLEKGDFRIYDVFTQEPTASNNSFPDVGITFDGVYMFCAATGFDASFASNHGGNLHYCDGENVYEANRYPAFTGTESCWTKEMTIVGGSLYYTNDGGEPVSLARKLWRMNKHTDTPELVCDLRPGQSDLIFGFRNLDGKLLFAQKDDNRSLYCYSYQKPGYDPAVDADDMEIEYRTRAEIASGVEGNVADQAKLAIYPNPATDQFSFDVKGTVTNVKVYDLAGKMVKDEATLTSNTVNVSGLSAGIYQVVIATTEGNYVASLIVK